MQLTVKPLQTHLKRHRPTQPPSPQDEAETRHASDTGRRAFEEAIKGISKYIVGELTASSSVRSRTAEHYVGEQSAAAAH